MHLRALKLSVGCYANYYFSGGIVLIGSLLALMFTENNLKTGYETSTQRDSCLFDPLITLLLTSSAIKEAGALCQLD